MRLGARGRAAAAALGVALVVLAAPALATTPEEALPTGEASQVSPGAEPAPEPDLLDEDEGLFGDEDDGVPVYDPLEPVNRRIFAFNEAFDAVLVEPLSEAYEFLVPSSARRAIRRAFVNINSPPIFVNDLLQLRFADAGKTLGRFALNSTLGMGGLFDAGKAAGWEHHQSDFGQTLAVYGAGSGPYLVLPVLGPSTVRDGFGQIVDVMFQPLTYLGGLSAAQQLFNITRGTATGFTLRVAQGEALEALEASSVDFYAALRSAYLQNRHAEIWGHPPLTDGNDGDGKAAARPGSEP